jgi:hypothetical protein
VKRGLVRFGFCYSRSGAAGAQFVPILLARVVLWAGRRRRDVMVVKSSGYSSPSLSQAGAGFNRQGFHPDHLHSLATGCWAGLDRCWMLAWVCRHRPLITSS